MGVRELIVLLAMCLVWGFHFVVIKVAVAELPPIFYAAVRMTLVAAVMSPFLRWRPEKGDNTRIGGIGKMTAVLTAGVCLGGLNYAFMFSGLKYATASAGAIAMELYVPFATIMSVIFLRERIGWRRGAGIVLAFAGVAVIALGGEQSGADNQLIIGVGLIACGVFFEALGAILVKQSVGFRPLELLAWFSLVGTIVLWLLTLVMESGQINAVAEADRVLVIGAILYSAVGASIFGHTAYYWLLQRLPVSTVAPSALLTTLLAVAFGVVLLGDPFNARFVLGGLMTIAGVAVVLFRAPDRITQPGSPMPLAPASTIQTKNDAAFQDLKSRK